MKNTSFDATRQRKLNKTLQTDNETLTKNLQSLTDKLTHSERDIASKRSLIETYKTRLNEFETNGNRSNDKSTSEVNREGGERAFVSTALFCLNRMMKID